MKPRNLLSQLSDLELALNSFSFEELSTSEAKRLKKSFERFKAELEAKFWGIEPEKDQETTPHHTSDEVHRPSKPEEAHLIAKVSHEIRTPLNGIMGFTELLRETPLSNKQMEQVNAIHLASRSLLEVINEFLDYSKLGAGLETFNAYPFNFHNLIKEVSYLCKTLILDKNIGFNVHVDPKIPGILIGDPSKLSQILLNLLGNAIKFVDKGHITLKVNVGKISNKRVVLEFMVEDSGIGIPEEDLEHIFDAFKQAGQHTFSKYGGTGLGLSIVKQIVTRLNGHIVVSSTLGKGTSFMMTLEYPIGGEISNDSIQRQPALNPLIRDLTVLVFEDNPLNQWLIKKRLKAWGCTHFVTENAEEGLRILAEEEVDMVFMDLHMPVVDGFEITRRIRASDQQKIKKVPIIALTADFSAMDKEQGGKDGINDYILKPYTPEELLEKLTFFGNPANKEKGFLGNIENVVKPALTKNKVSKLDLTAVLEECMGDIEMLEELVALYKRNALEFIGKVKLHLQYRDHAQVQFATHKMKSGLAMMQTHNLLILVQQMNEHSKTDKNFDQMGYLYEQFLKEYPMVEFALDSEVTRLKKQT